MIISTNKLPIVIVANYRTGSSALAKHLANTLNITGLVEPHYKTDKWKEFINCISNNSKSFVLKFIAEQSIEIKEYKNILEHDCCKIRLYREDKLEQIVSYYIATVTDVWFQNTSSVVPVVIPYDEEKAKYAISRILYNDIILNKLTMDFDYTLTYEELGFIESTDLVKTTQPVNMNRIKQFIGKIYNEYR